MTSQFQGADVTAPLRAAPFSARRYHIRLDKTHVACMSSRAYIISDVVVCSSRATGNVLERCDYKCEFGMCPTIL